MRLREDMPQLEGATDWLNCNGLQKEDLIGKPTLFHFWSVSCQQCKKEFPDMNQVRDTYRARLNMIAVHMPRSNDDLYIEDIESAARVFNISQPIYVDNNHILTDRFSVRYVPAYFLFDEEGKLRHYQGGDSSVNLLLKRIDRFVQ